MDRSLTNKIVVSLIVFFAIVLVVFPVHAIPIVSIQPPNSTPIVGTNFSVDVAVSGATDIAGWQFNLMFDPTIINAVDVVEGPFLQTGGITVFFEGTIDNTLGKTGLWGAALLGPNLGVTGSGVLASILFNALSTGFSPLTLSDVILVDSEANGIIPATQNGSVNPVPEPSTMLLIGTGLIGLAGWGRRKFKK